jgi:3-hydroxybutyryl-CoA dehydrogenase
MGPETIAVVGAGMMGRGVAISAALAGYRTLCIKATGGDPGIPRGRCHAELAQLVKKGKLAPEVRDAAIARLSFSQDRDALGEATLVVESIKEDVAAKRTVFRDLERRVADTTVLASNTSSLSLDEIAAGMAHPDRFLGLHFFSPVTAMRLVEIAAPPATADAAIATARGFIERIGKTPVLVGDTPGYIVNRLLVPYLLDAIRTLERGVAPAESIDAAMKLGCGHPLGPLALADAIGLDVVLAMAESLGAALGAEDPQQAARYDAPALLRQLVAESKLGKKTGAGLYTY